MKNKLKHEDQQIIDALKMLQHTTGHLMQLLDMREDGDLLLTKDYPFDCCFREIAVKVDKWLEATEDKFYAKKEYVAPTVTLSKKPIISTCTFINTGGGTMISEMILADHQQVKRLWMNEEGVSAYDSVEYNENDCPILDITKYSELIPLIGEEAADQVMHELKRYCSKYNCTTTMGDGKWTNTFGLHNMKTTAHCDAQNLVCDFIEHLDKSTEEMLDIVDEQQHDSRFDSDEHFKKYNIRISTNGKFVELDINADLYTRLRQLLVEEYNEM